MKRDSPGGRGKGGGTGDGGKGEGGDNTITGGARVRFPAPG
jgi:hypothetical protein